jgi:hypothetical protein
VSDQGPRGAPPFQELDAAYHELMQGLWYAHLVFASKGDAGREGVRIACHAVARFIGVRHENPELAAPLLAMRQALDDWEKGLDTELLTKNPHEMERSRSGQKRHVKALASACLEVLVGEMGLDAAARYVARHVSGWPGIGAQEVTATTLQNWRTEERAAPPSVKTPFQVMVADLRSRKDARAEVERLLRDGPPGIPKS